MPSIALGGVKVAPQRISKTRIRELAAEHIEREAHASIRSAIAAVMAQAPTVQEQQHRVAEIMGGIDVPPAFTVKLLYESLKGNHASITQEMVALLFDDATEDEVADAMRVILGAVVVDAEPEPSAPAVPQKPSADQDAEQAELVVEAIKRLSERHPDRDGKFDTFEEVQPEMMQIVLERQQNGSRDQGR